MAKSNRDLLHDTFIEEVMKMNNKRKQREMFENPDKLSKDGRVYMKKGSDGLIRAAQKKSISDESITKKDTKNKNNSILKSSYIVGSMTFISRISGFIRDIIFANIFGASTSTDAFFVAFKIPNFFRRLFAEGAFIQAFVPILNEFKI